MRDWDGGCRQVVTSKQPIRAWRPPPKGRPGEESGLTDLALDPSPLLLSKHEVPCGPVRPTYHLDVQYLVLANHLVNPNVGEESLDVRWFAHDQLPEVDHSVVALVRAAGVRLGW